jgi:DUF1365 family protein
MSDAVLHSAIYRGVVRHVRTTPKARAFAYRLFMLYLDLDELDRAFAGRWLWGLERARPFSFRRRDYLGPRDLPLAEAARLRVQRELGFLPRGPVRLLTNLRALGLSFNPVSFYYCFEPDGSLAAVVAEITNTPWLERHAYALDARGNSGTVRARFAKRFHVSPFQPMQQDYDWLLEAPGERLAVHMRNWQGNAVVHRATLALHRQPWSGPNLAAALSRHPAMAIKVVAGIYWQAARLWAGRAPFFDHPRPAEVR